MIDFDNCKYLKLRKDRTPRDKDVADLLIPGEQVLGSYTTLRDYVVFTDKRVIAVNAQGVTGAKRDFTSLPYSKVTVFSIETAGVMDIDSELELYFSGIGRVRFEFFCSSNILALGQAISRYILR